MLAAELGEFLNDIFGDDGILKLGEDGEEWAVAKVGDMGKGGDLCHHLADNY